jgi:hypothetical protein
MTTVTDLARGIDRDFEVRQLGEWLDAYGDRETWPPRVRRAYAHAVAEHRAAVRQGADWLESGHEGAQS